MLNEFIGILLGCVHYFVTEEYIPLVDAIAVPVFLALILVFLFGSSIFILKTIIRAIWSGV